MKKSGYGFLLTTDFSQFFVPMSFSISRSFPFFFLLTISTQRSEFRAGRKVSKFSCTLTQDGLEKRRFPRSRKCSPRESNEREEIEEKGRRYIAVSERRKVPETRVGETNHREIVTEWLRDFSTTVFRDHTRRFCVFFNVQLKIETTIPSNFWFYSHSIILYSLEIKLTTPAIPIYPRNS